MLLQEPERVRTALSPLRRSLLERLREPASATRVAAELGIPRQRVNYHLRELERAGLVELVEERQATWLHRARARRRATSWSTPR